MDLKSENERLRAENRKLRKEIKQWQENIRGIAEFLESAERGRIAREKWRDEHPIIRGSTRAAPVSTAPR